MFFACVVAATWSFSLLLTFPVMKVLLQGQDLQQYVREEIDTLETEIATNASGGQISGETISLKILRLLDENVMRHVPSDQFDMLALIFLILLIVTVIKGGSRVLQETLVVSVVEKTIIAMREKCFKMVLALDYQSLAMEGTPALMSRFTYDLGLVRDGLIVVGVKLIREPLKGMACLVCAFYVNWRLTLLSLLFVPLAGVVFYNIGRKLKKASHHLMESMSRLYKVLEESFHAIKILIAYGGASKQNEKFEKENKEYYSKAMTIARFDALSSPTMELLGVFAILLGMLPGTYLVLREARYIWGIELSGHVMEFAELAVLYTLLAGIVDPARKLSTVFGTFRKAKVAAGRLLELMDRETLVRETSDPRELPRHSRCIEFEEVSFRYAKKSDDAAARKAALQHVSLTVDVGEVVAVVGENGSGKSTLVNLLPRFFDPEFGSVKIDGIDIRDVALADLRQQIGVVTQETLLFDESIEENIRYGKPNASREEVIRAAKQAEALSFIESLPDGFETCVGDKGRNLSGGQCQRISLARAIIRDPAILILDEATSAVDSQSELQLHNVLQAFVKGRTTFIITHTVRPSLLDLISRIVVMDQGRLISVGTHETLLDGCEIYQRLFHSQTRRKSA